MHELIQESEVEKAVQIIFDDYNRGKHIDNIDIYNRPDQAEIQTILQNLIRVVYPGSYRRYVLPPPQTGGNCARLLQIARFHDLGRAQN